MPFGSCKPFDCNMGPIRYVLSIHPFERSLMSLPFSLPLLIVRHVCVCVRETRRSIKNPCRAWPTLLRHLRRHCPRRLL